MKKEQLKGDCAYISEGVRVKDQWKGEGKKQDSRGISTREYGTEKKKKKLWVGKRTSERTASRHMMDFLFDPWSSISHAKQAGEVVLAPPCVALASVSPRVKKVSGSQYPIFPIKPNYALCLLRCSSPRLHVLLFADASVLI